MLKPIPLPFRPYGGWQHSAWVDFVTRNSEMEFGKRQTLLMNSSTIKTLEHHARVVNALGYHRERLYRDKWFLWREVKHDVFNLGFDCEDQALEKWFRFVNEGYPIGAFFPILCFCRDGTWHCVLGVNFENGVAILDNENRWNRNRKHELHSWDKSNHEMKFCLIENREWGICGNFKPVRIQ